MICTDMICTDMICTDMICTDMICTNVILTTKGDNVKKYSVDYGLEDFGGPSGIRTRVAALKGLCPRPLDDGT